ncbi:cd2 antigen cytoplasmic tail-binding protein 2 [Phtheirospermum japonicum]|uniref:Cd2 antigen cytoplasmic tail-binding protein 2 n=1 Tax=Phtheirospermum japonicum TaxID=374723 RepID=A0A830CUJ8_9LAMI|nr:cd2 antigen cytoplasmic tail-binding protein 2 [Phtheirospermum japonicum]
MAEGSSRGNLKRSFVEDDESNKPPPEKRAKFPKGKKIKGEYVIDSLGGEIPCWKDPRSAASVRAVRRKDVPPELLNVENTDLVPDVRKAEVQYKDNDTFDEEGVAMEPFNLEKEREDGYFDENGNYVEYANKNEIKDAWLDSVDVCEKYAGKSKIHMSIDEKPQELVREELAEMNRRIADVLEPGETVLRGLRRLKGSSNKKQKMSAETKKLFDQLTEDAMKLMENGDYNVYDEKQEHFAREAEGYEKLANARKHGISAPEKSDDMFDMFGDDVGTAAENPSVSVQQSENDYVYDESSGYYYSSSLGYYYDPSSGLYCCATSGKWYSYNEESGMYDEVQQATNVAETS